MAFVRTSQSVANYFSPLNEALAVQVFAMNQYYKSVEIELPTNAQLLEKREIKHSEHLGYFYGEHWNIYINRENRCFLEFDVGHFSPEFIVREITYENYCSLKEDKYLFNKISINVR